jgi:gluconolactonase
MKTLISLTVLFLFIFFPACKKNTDLISDEAELTELASGFSFTEGPAVDKEGNVYFTDQPNNRIHKWDAKSGAISVFLEPSGRANGLFVDNEGNLIACADEEFQLWRISPQKEITVLVYDYKGKKLNGPNDVWADSKGGIYFTDPYYQRPYWDRKAPEMKEQRVYYFNPEGTELRIVAEDLVQPNGIIGSPDGSTLYVADIGDKKTYSYSITKDGSLARRKLLVEMGSDGMTLDNRGNLYLTGDGVTIVNEKGGKIHHIPVPQSWTTNVTFGGPEQKTLFITAMGSVYTLEMNVHGVR